MKIRTVLFAATLTLFGVTSVHAQSGQELFQQALVQEQAEGDLRAAIRLYTQIVTDYVLDRPLVARALMRIGAAYDKLGDDAARTAYERIVADYADQREALRVAQERLRVLDPGGVGAAMDSGINPSFTLLTDLGQRPGRRNWVDYSPDGSRFVTVRPIASGRSEPQEALFLSDRAGGGLHPVPGVMGHAPRAPQWSPDGTMIAYQDHTHPDDGIAGSKLTRIYVVSESGGEPRQIAPDLFSVDDGSGTDDAYSSPIWTPSGNISYLNKQTNLLVTVDPSGNTVREWSLASDAHREAGLLPHGVSVWGYSPDGRWLALTVYNEEDGRAFWVMPANGGRVRHLVATRGSAEFNGWQGVGFAWDPDGRSVYVAGLRGNGSNDIHRLDFDSRRGEISGEPKLVAAFNSGQVNRLKMLAGGTLTYQRTTVTQLIVTASTSNPQATRTVARGTSGQVSPDGQTVYYVGEGYGREGIFAIPTTGGEPRRVTSTVPAHGGFLLSPDASEVAFHTHAGAETSMTIMPTRGGDPRLVAQTVSGEAATPVWSPDGSELAFSNGGDLFVMPAGGGSRIRIAQILNWDSESIQWSPDGAFVAGLGMEEGDVNEAIFAVPSNGGALRRLTRPDENRTKEGLEWHPDSQRLSYMNYDPDGSRLAYLDGRPTTLLVKLDSGWDYVGGWTPDGSTYLFYSDSNLPGNGVFAYDEASGRTTEFYAHGLGFRHAGEALGFTWSQDRRTFTAGKRVISVQNWLIEGLH